MHLDVKPANVLLTADGGVRLGDFGVAARCPARRRRGTPLFVAPEVITTGIARCAADAWSYGVVVYTLLVGFPPFFPHERGTHGELEEQVRCGTTQWFNQRARHRSNEGLSASPLCFGPCTRTRCACARCDARGPRAVCVCVFSEEMHTILFDLI